MKARTQKAAHAIVQILCYNNLPNVSSILILKTCASSQVKVIFLMLLPLLKRDQMVFKCTQERQWIVLAGSFLYCNLGNPNYASDFITYGLGNMLDFLVSLPDSCFSCVIRVSSICGEDYFAIHFVLYLPQ